MQTSSSPARRAVAPQRAATQLAFLLLAAGLAAGCGCAEEHVAPPTHLRAVVQPPPEPFGPLLSHYGMARLRLTWDPSPTLAAAEGGRYVVFQVSGARLDVRNPVASVPASQTTAIVPVVVPPGDPPPLYEVVAEGPGGGTSAHSGSGLLSAPRFLDGLPLLHAGEAPDCLPSVPITAFAPDGRGGVWVATEGGGVAWYSPAAANGDAAGTWRRFTSLDGLLDDRVLSLAAAPDGGVWLGGPSGLQHLAPTSGALRTWLGPGDGVPGAVTAVAVDPAGVLWLATGGALARMAPGMGRPLVLSEAAPDGLRADTLLGDLGSLAAQRVWQAHVDRTPLGSDVVTHVTVAPDGAVWVAGPGLGVVRQAAGGFSWRRFPLPASGPAAAGIRGLAPGAGASAWVGTADALLYLTEEGTWQPVPLVFVGLTAGVQGVAADGGGRTAALIGDTLVSCAAAPLPVCAPLAELPARPARAWAVVAADEGGGLWLGGSDGRVEWRGDAENEGRPLAGACPAEPPPGDLSTVAVAPDGAVWLASPVAVARRSPAGTWTAARSGGAGPELPVSALTFDPFGNVYGATAGGLAIRFVEPPLWTMVPSAEAGRPPAAVALTSGRRLWTGGADGLRLFDLAGAGRAESVPLVGRSAVVEVTALAARPDGGLWIGTRAGLFRWTLGRGMEGPAALDGTDEPVDALATDGASGLWVATAAGLHRHSALLGGVGRYPLPDGWPGDPIVAIASRGDGVALATRAGRLGCAYNAGGRVSERLDLTRARPGLVVRGLALDPTGTAWLATKGAGLVAVPALCP